MRPRRKQQLAAEPGWTNRRRYQLQPREHLPERPTLLRPGQQSLADETLTSAGNLPRPALTVALPVPEIDWSYAVIERMNPQTLTTSLVPFNPGQLVLEHDAAQNLALEPGDVVTIFSQADIKVPQTQRTKFVRLEGEFKQAGIYSALPGETLRQLVARAGGFTPEAYLFGSNFTRESTRILQQLRLNDYLQNLELEIDRATIAASASIGTAWTRLPTAASRSLVARFRTIRATGRVVLDISQTAIGNRQSARHATGRRRSLRGSFQAQHGECRRRGIRSEFFPVP